ncbi:S-layer family protein [uncultured Methanobrevibacter sp.]|uniref:beta strand repeat-containing protein n=1 Tax=uncultured Methanobrevibacter sp. TaxID=253161 RepID=UPI002618DE74|nr:Ig-like domain repeat protein [uncultured Methanobrevibacter sp.]
MSLKRTFGVLILLLVLLSVSAVSAENISDSTNNTYYASDDVQKDFSSLQTDIDNSQGVFNLDYDVKHGDDESDVYGITITKSMTINGNGHTIDANNYGGIFIVKDSSVVLTLNDLTLINANPVSNDAGIVSDGGAIFFSGSSLMVNNVNFKNNTVYKFGGAIYTTGTCIVDNSVFDGNDVEYRSANIDAGGAAIYADKGAMLLLSNSQIINNLKNMVIRNNNVGDLIDGVVTVTGYTKISKSYFGNNSGCYGGAVTSLGYLFDRNTVIIEDSTFDGNRAFQGSAVNIYTSIFKISGTKFLNNKGVGYGSGNPNVGALLTWYGCEGTISKCDFINNTAENGAAYRCGDDRRTNSSAIVDSCTFINNTASKYGGAIYEGGQLGTFNLNIKNSTFIDNSAKKDGSAIYNGYTLTIDNDSTFTNNTLYNYYSATLNLDEIKTFSDLQRAVSIVEGYVTLTSNVTMLDSEAAKFVNGIVVDHMVNIRANGFTINANNLGRIFNVTSTGNLNIYNGNLINGKADIGGAIYNNGKVYAYNSTFKNNTADTMGGAIFNNANLEIQKCIIDGNDIIKRTASSAEDYGGAAIYNWYGATLKITNSTISNNLKNYKNGDRVLGAVTSLGTATIQKNSYFINNSGRWGGAICSSGNALSGTKVNKLTISDATFSENKGLYGAGIFISGSNFEIKNSVFDGNSAFGKGDMTPNNNNGAAIVVSDTKKSITGKITGTKFTNNKAQYGGALDICAGKITISTSEFVNNSADVEGGAIVVDSAISDAKVTISNSKFINNSAKYGGAICNMLDLTIKNSEFSDNNPDAIFNHVKWGGNLDLGIKTFTDLQNAVNLVSSTLTLNSNIAMSDDEAVNFVNGVVVNKNLVIDGRGHTVDARNLGRIFSVGAGYTVTLTNITLINGKADKGGAVYNDGKLTISNANLNSNTADKFGGAVFNNGDLIVKDSVFDANDIIDRKSDSVDHGGAAIYNWYDGTLVVSGSNFTNNIKNYNNGDRLVGAIATMGGITITGSTFVNNSGRWGGAISTAGYLLSGDDVGTLNVVDSIFKDNVALYGGAIDIVGNNYIISNSVFDNNTALGKGDMTPNNNNGGAIVVTDSGKTIVGTIEKSNFTNNNAHYGGALWINEGEITISTSLFENNTAVEDGGAIGFGSAYHNVIASVEDSIFKNNFAKYAGAITNTKYLTVDNSTFIDNVKGTILNQKDINMNIKDFTGLQNAVNWVDGILILDSDIAMSDDEAVNFVNGVVINKNLIINGRGHTVDARNLGRIFSVGAEYTVTLTNINLVNGKADIGGAVYNEGKLTISNANLNSNTAGKFGGAVFNNGDLIVRNSVFDANDIIDRKSDSVDHGGAAIYNWYDGTLVVSGSNFTNNIKNYNNGDNLVGAVTSIGNATISGSTFINNFGRWGGALSATGAELRKNTSTLTLSNSVFKDNTALYGGAVYVWGSNYNIADCVFDNNTALGKGNMTPNNNNGGALVVSQVSKFKESITGTITGSNFTNNKAQYGGAAWFNKGSVTIEDSIFENNTATAEGGALGFSPVRNDLIVTINNASFTNNSAILGGAIYNNVGLNVTNSSFNNNKATNHGDIIFNDVKGSLTIENNEYLGLSEDKTPIYNTGNLSSKIEVIILGNKTVDVAYGKEIPLTAVIYVDGVLVSGEKLFFEIEGKNILATSLVNGTYIAYCEVSSIGEKLVNANYNVASEVVIKTAILNVVQGPINLDVDVSDINVGDLQIITINVPKDATGLLTIMMNGEDYILPIYDGKAMFYYPDLTAGHYEFTVSYSGDKNYLANTTTAQFDVNKLTADFNVNIWGELVFGEIGIVSINLPSDINGIIDVYIDGEKYTVNVVNGIATFGLPELSVGSHVLSVNYGGNDKYLTNEVTMDFGIVKANPSLNIIINNVDYDNVFVINAVLTGVNNAPLTGNVIVTVNGKQYTVNVVDGKGILVADKLATGSYDFAANWAGNDNYNFAQDSGNFNVNKIASTIDVLVDDINVGEDVTINVNVPVDATGNVVISVNGEDYIASIVDGKATKIISNLKAGSYDVTVKYDGDNNYNGASSAAKFVVSKVNPVIDVIADNIVFGNDLTVNVVLSSDATGDVVITVNGKDYTVTIINGKATQAISGLDAGDHNIVVKYIGDDKYSPVEITKTVSVAKANPVLDVVIDDVDYNNVFTIEATLNGVNNAKLTGDVIVTVNGKDYTVKVVDGKGTLEGINLPAGSYDFTAKFNGNNNYDPVIDSSNFKVNKLNSTIDISVDNIKVGENLTIAVTVPVDATGDVIITVDDVDYVATIVNGKAIKVVSNLKANDYVVNVRYDGDNNYNATQNATTVSVSKISDYDMSIDILEDVKVGDDVIIIVNVPKDAAGKVTIVVDGIYYSAVVDNGIAKIIVSNLELGDHSVSAIFSDDKYSQNEVNSTIVVSKVSDYDMNITIPEVKSGSDTTITIDVPNDATGTVTVEINGTKYVGVINNGGANVTISALDVGQYDVTVTYSGDEKYNSMTKKENITVIQNTDVNLNVEDIVMFYHDGTRLIAILTDYLGNPIANATLYFTINGQTYSRITDENGNASIALNLISGIYQATISYNGSEIYGNASKNITVTINSTIDGQNIVKMYQNGTQFFATFYDNYGNILANTLVRFNINGVFYTRTTDENGTARLAINLRPGEYILTAYNNVSGEERGFNITVKSLIETADLTKYFQNASKFEATIYNKDGSLAIGKDVTFNINGVFYTRTTDENGIARLAINLRPGNHIITTIVDDLEVGNNITVLPTLITEDLEMTFKDGSSFNAKIVDGQGMPLSNQNVTFNVNGLFYYKVTNDEGIASLTINLMSGEYVITSIWNDFQVGNTIKIV